MSKLIKLSTGKTVNEVTAALQAVVSANRFDVTQVLNLKELTKRGLKFARECVIVEICQLHQGNAALDDNMGASTVLPCRISIYVKGGRTILAALKPTSVLSMFNAPQLARVARELEAAIVKIMREAARGGGQRVPA